MNIQTNNILNWKKVIKLWDRFDKRMNDAGYMLHVVSGIRGLTDGTVAFKQDTYAPFFRFMVFRMHSDEYSFTIAVRDRNGDKVMDGKTIGYMRFSEYTEEKVDEAIDFILETFGCYKKENTVPTKFTPIEKTF